VREFSVAVGRFAVSFPQFTQLGRRNTEHAHQHRVANGYQRNVEHREERRRPADRASDGQMSWALDSTHPRLDVSGDSRMRKFRKRKFEALSPLWFGAILRGIGRVWMTAENVVHAEPADDECRDCGCEPELARTFGSFHVFSFQQGVSPEPAP
jgi:hypothetical protein